MANINLLPWREERRQERQKEFVAMLLATALAAGGIILLIDMVIRDDISNQNARNSYLQTNINELNNQVREIKELERKKKELLDRMKVIQELQGNRPVIVRIFDEMVRTLPDGVFYQDLSRKNDTITLSGNSESNNRISSLMRKLDGSDWFSAPNLTAVKANPEFGEQASSFELSFKTSTPSAESEEAEK